jgi:hypothetical protein
MIHPGLEPLALASRVVRFQRVFSTTLKASDRKLSSGTEIPQKLHEKLCLENRCAVERKFVDSTTKSLEKS